MEMTTETTETETKGHYQKADLDRFYSEAEGIDSEVFSEMRSSLLLVAGEHYAKKDSAFFRRIRDSKDLSKEQKLRLTKNHVRKICQLYANQIVSAKPGVGFSPKNDDSTHDLKAAELHHSVWMDAFEKYDVDDKIDQWVDSYVQIGEVHTKIFWDESMGPVVGYAPLKDEAGNLTLDFMGNEQPDLSSPVASGQFVFEEIYGFNLLRPSECKDIDQAEYLIGRKMVGIENLKLKFPDKAEAISQSPDETYKIFDLSRGGYSDSNKQTLLKEFYFRPCLKYPKGYFYFATKEVILAEGELPGGVFPIISQLFDKLKTTPRGRSPVKTMRPYQAEINRGASKMAEHQITIGDDKLLVQNGSKVSAGVSLPGVRTVSYTGEKPGILAGRDGAQYLATIQQNIAELYQVMMVTEIEQDAEAKLDPYTLLFRSAKEKKKFQRYIKGFEKFLIKVVKTYLNLAKKHLPDDAVIFAIGKNEQVNIPEFRQYSDTNFDVKIESQADDIETKLGKQIAQNHILQYVGAQLSQDQIGKIIKQMPYVDNSEAFDDITMDSDSAVNDELALDRGEKPPINQYDNHPYMIKRLTLRTRKSDFKQLDQSIQYNYRQKIALHQQFDAQNKLAIQRAEAGYIPTDGALITVDFYVNAPNSNGGVKQQKAKVPYQAIDWLLKQMEVQGASQQSFAGYTQGTQAEIANMMTGQQSPAEAQPEPFAPMMG